MWPFNQKKQTLRIVDRAIHHLRTDNWVEAKRAFEVAESSLKHLPIPQQVNVLMGLALCHLAKGGNTEARDFLARTHPIIVTGTNVAKFVGVLEKACEVNHLANALIIPPGNSELVILDNCVPAGISFLKFSFLKLVVDA